MFTNIGEYLKDERKNRNLSLKDVEKETRIRKKNLIAIEAGRWEAFPSRTYIQGVITSYGKYLSLDEKKLIAYFRREYELRDKVFFKRKATRDSFNPQTKKIAKLFIFFIIGIFVVYFGYQIKLYYTPPSVIILKPTKSTFKNENKITLKGQTEKDVIITVNKKRIYPDDKNIFEAQIPLVNKENLVVIEVTGANGQKTTIKKVFIKEEI